MKGFLSDKNSLEFQIPPLLYKALKEESRQTLGSLKTGINDSDISGRSLLRKLFELAVIHSELALDIIKGGKGFIIPLQSSLPI